MSLDILVNQQYEVPPEHLALFHIPGGILRQLLLFPDDVDIMDIVVDHDHHPVGLILKLRGPEFKIVNDGWTIPYVKASYHSEHTDDGVKAFFDGWNVL